MDKKIVSSTSMNRDTFNAQNGKRKQPKMNIRRPSSPTNHYIHQPQRNNIQQPKCSNRQTPSSDVEFIQANSKIWLNENYLNLNNYNSNEIHWNSIVQINFKSHEEVTCPICMETPKVGRTGKCGHIYCLPCLIQYLSVDNYANTKCALCNQHLNLSHIKRAAVIQNLSLKEGDHISMLLMKRNRTNGYNTIPVPIEKKFTSYLPNKNSSSGCFSDTLICSKEDLLTILQEEIMILEDWLTESIKDKDNCDKFICEAINMVRNELKDSLLIKNVLSINNEEEKKELTFGYLNEIMNSNYVYYQEEGGDYIFICPLNWSCLKFEYQDKGLPLPNRISGKILEMEKFTCNEDFLYRYRYLRNIPKGATVQFVDVDINHLLSPETLDKFKDRLMKKMVNRFIQQKLDKELEDQKMEAENSYSKNTINYTIVPSVTNKNIFDPDEFIPLTASTQTIVNDIQGPSYARMVRAFNQPTSTNITEDPTFTSSEAPGFTLNDCVVLKKSKKNNKRK